jgi:hypothetical protein
MIAMIIFAVLKKGDETEVSYILQLKTTDDHYDGLNENNVQKFRGKGLGRFLIELVKCYTYGKSTKLKSDVVLKISNNRNDNFFEHIGFQEIGSGNKWIGVISDFESRTNFIQRGKHKAYHLPHEEKIRHREVVDPGQLKCISFEEVVYHWSYE